MRQNRIEPVDVAQRVEEYVEKERQDVKSYDNRALLDESGIFALHLLAAEVYQQGWTDGCQTAAEAGRKQRQRMDEEHKDRLAAIEHGEESDG